MQSLLLSATFLSSPGLPGGDGGDAGFNPALTTASTAASGTTGEDDSARTGLFEGLLAAVNPGSVQRQPARVTVETAGATTTPTGNAPETAGLATATPDGQPAPVAPRASNPMAQPATWNPLSALEYSARSGTDSIATAGDPAITAALVPGVPTANPAPNSDPNVVPAPAPGTAPNLVATNPARPDAIEVAVTPQLLQRDTGLTATPTQVVLPESTPDTAAVQNAVAQNAAARSGLVAGNQAEASAVPAQAATPGQTGTPASPAQPALVSTKPHPTAATLKPTAGKSLDANAQKDVAPHDPTAVRRSGTSLEQAAAPKAWTTPTSAAPIASATPAQSELATPTPASGFDAAPVVTRADAQGEPAPVQLTATATPASAGASPNLAAAPAPLTDTSTPDTQLVASAAPSGTVAPDRAPVDLPRPVATSPVAAPVTPAAPGLAPQSPVQGQDALNATPALAPQTAETANPAVPPTSSGLTPVQPSAPQAGQPVQAQPAFADTRQPAQPVANAHSQSAAPAPLQQPAVTPQQVSQVATEFAPQASATPTSTPAAQLAKRHTAAPGVSATKSNASSAKSAAPSATVSAAPTASASQVAPADAKLLDPATPALTSAPVLAPLGEAMHTTAMTGDDAVATSTGFDSQGTRVHGTHQADRPAGADVPRFTAQSAAHLAGQITRRFNNGNRVFDIRLDPAELGRVDVRLEMTGDNRVQAYLTVERPETLLELQRTARELERALSDAGLDLDGEGLNFQLSDDAGEGQFENMSDDALPVFEQSGDVELVAETQDPAPERTEYGFRLAGARDRIDMRI